MNTNNQNNNVFADAVEMGYEQDYRLIRNFLQYLQELKPIYQGKGSLTGPLPFSGYTGHHVTGSFMSGYPVSIPSEEHLFDTGQRCKTSFLVFKHQKYTTVRTEDIAFFYIRNDGVSIRCFDQQEFSINKSLEKVAGSVSPDEFFRVNRRYLVNFKAIKEVEHYFLRKLFVKLLVETPEKLLINKEKTQQFLSWLENR